MSVVDPTTLVEYREIPGISGYRFGSDGSAWTCWIRRPWHKSVLGKEWRRLKPGKGRNGYPIISLRQMGDEASRTRTLHSLVATAFHGLCPPGMECRHLDGNRGNPRADNLAWGTHEENGSDMVNHGRINSGSKCHRSKLSACDVQEIRRIYAAGKTLKEISGDFGVSIHAIWCIIKRITWKHVE